MRKNNLNFESLKPKLKDFFSGFFDNLKLHTDNILMFIFFIMILLWAFIFYEFAYKLSVSSPQISVNVLKIKKERLDKIADDIKKREAARENIDFSNMKNPFENNLIIEEKEKIKESGDALMKSRIKQLY